MSLKVARLKAMDAVFISISNLAPAMARAAGRSWVWCIRRICDLEAAGCTCQIEMWGCRVIFMKVLLFGQFKAFSHSHSFSARGVAEVGRRVNFQ